MARNFKDLSEREVLALAISLEEEDGRIYADFADALRESYPASAAMFDEMREEEGHAVPAGGVSGGHRRARVPDGNIDWKLLRLG